MAEPGALAEPERNRLLRQVDWRFLLDQTEAPRLAGPPPAHLARAIGLVAAAEPAATGEADLAVTGFPRRAALGDAAAALRPGGAVVCVWRAPRLGGASRAARRLRQAGFEAVSVHWPGPRRAPQFWLPLDAPAATSHLLAARPPQNAFQALLRPLWRLAVRLGALTPLCAIGRLPGGEDPTDGLAKAIPAGSDLLLLTGGKRSINKVVALPFAAGSPAPAAVVKFARVVAADAALDREATALRALAAEHPVLAGVPRLLARERRVGRRALVESAVHGQALIEVLRPHDFAALSGAVGTWLTGLVGAESRPASEWWERLVGAPLAAFERDFGAVVSAETLAALRGRLRGLDALPSACEHRDCSPWNVVLDDDGAPGLHDWESAEPNGLPGLDLAYFLANCAFVLDGALDSGRTRESYRRLLDPATPYGGVAAAGVAGYCERTGLDPTAFPDLRLLAWVVHARSDYVHRELAAAGPPTPESLRDAPYLGLIETDLTLAP